MVTFRSPSSCTRTSARTETLNPLSASRPERDTVQARRDAEWVGLEQRVDLGLDVRLEVDVPAVDEPTHDVDEQVGDVGRIPRALVVETKRRLVVAREHPVDDERVQVDVEVQTGAEALDRGDAAGLARLAAPDAAFASATRIGHAERVVQRSPHGTREARVVRHLRAELEGHGEYELPDRSAREHGVDEMRREAGHALAAAARTGAAGLAGEGDEPLARAVFARELDEASGEVAARGERGERVHDERRKASRQ